MAERQDESFGALGVENSTEDSKESDPETESLSDTEDEPLSLLPPPRESRLGDLRGSSGGLAVSGNEVETLTAGSSAQRSCDDHREGLPGNSTQREESKDQDKVSQQGIITGITGQALQPQARNLLVPCIHRTSLEELSPTSVPQSVPSGIIVGNSCLAVADLENSSSRKPVLTMATVKASGADGYKWRKYGQKQIKSPQGSRSYLRCTYSECRAKKIEFSDQSGHVRETIYKSQHNHDPPRKISSASQRRIVKNVRSPIENNATEGSVRVLNGSNPSRSSRESVRDTSIVPIGRQQDSRSIHGDAETTYKSDNALEPTHRGKKNSFSYSSPQLKPGKKPKYVLRAAGDVGISSDGYRWRKYGQKMVKGKPHPRNYYRCTSAGCPVRKHIETAVDDASAVIITYRGTHDHDMPVPKKRHGLPSAASLAAAASPTSLSSTQGRKPDPSQSESPTRSSLIDKGEGDLTGDAMELGGEKAMESARTLLSIGFEFKPC